MILSSHSRTTAKEVSSGGGSARMSWSKIKKKSAPAHDFLGAGFGAKSAMLIERWYASQAFLHPQKLFRTAHLEWGQALRL